MLFLKNKVPQKKINKKKLNSIRLSTMVARSFLYMLFNIDDKFSHKQKNKLEYTHKKNSNL